MWVRLILILFAFLIFYQPAVDAKQLFKPAKLYPVDEGWKDKSFVKFRNKLIDIARRKDVNALIPYIDEKIQFSFGGGIGRKEFLKEWDLKPGHSSKTSDQFWKNFNKVITHGGTIEKGYTIKQHYGWCYEDKETMRKCKKEKLPFKSFLAKDFLAPYYTAVWSDERYDSFEFSSVIGKNVNAYKKVKNRLIPYKQLSYEVVKVVTRKNEPECKNKDNHCIFINDENEERFRYKNRIYKAILISTGEKLYINEDYLGNACIWDYRAAFEGTKDGKWLMDIFIFGD